MTYHNITKALLLSSALVAVSSQALAQSVSDPAEDEIIVVGTHIKGLKVSGALPVSLISADDIDALGIDSGEDLFRSIPSQGAVNFSGDSETGGVNGARGDVSSINLRSLGSGYTLTLINGRRTVLHPGVQTENLAPVVTANLNALPTAGIKRVEVLRDGASAIYGADAVGGVVNTVLKDNYTGLQLTAKYGSYDGLDANGLTLDGYGGFDLREGRTNVTIFGSYYKRDGIFASERDYSASDDRRPFVEGTDFDGDTQFRNLSTNTAWGQFDTTQRVRVASTNATITSSAGRFHVQPQTSAGCRIDLNTDICVDDGSLNSDLRHNTALLDQMTSDLKRYNAFMFINHELDNGNEFYSELSYYQADSNKEREANTLLSSTPINMSPTAYYNIFGAVGTPGRLADITAPTDGLSIEFGGPNGRYRVLDAGPRLLDVRNTSFRAVAGLRGDWKDWSFDTAFVLSAAETNDVTSNRISSTLFQQVLNRTTADAYNPFNGGDINDVSGLDATPNPQSVIDGFLIDVRRDAKTSLGMIDFKISNPSVWSLPGGDVGAAFGVEYRHIGYEDDRDNRLDGTQKFTDTVTGITYDSDVMGSSATPDTKGDRRTISAFAEFYVPIVSADQNIPLIHSLNLQLAGRYEDASDFGGEFAPKVALSWFPFEFLQVRSAYSEGFVAPNLNVINAEGLQRSNTRTDHYRCQAQINLGTLADMNACGEAQGVLSIRTGSKELKAQQYKNFSLGVVLQPDQLIPGLTLTADYFNIEQDQIVGIAGDQLQLILDFTRRLNGSTNDAVLRAAPDADDIAFFAGSGLAAVGSIISVQDPFLNLDVRTSEGIDFGFYYDYDDTPIGDFNFKVEVSHLFTFDQAANSLSQEIRQETAADLINLVGVGSLLEQNGRPKWSGNARLTWKKGNFGAGASVNYIGSFFDTSATQNTTGDFFPVEKWVTGNAYVQYTFRDMFNSQFDKVRLRVGATNITNEDPPLSDETYGYDSAYHSNRGRFVYGQIRTTF
ncbi:MAG: TonB-dependent receptor [Alphaproteobacteria bacterium]|nr:MAG: TonB-dependent receptor [Alphaproteobacteria bacterium]